MSTNWNTYTLSIYIEPNIIDILSTSLSFSKECGNNFEPPTYSGG